MPRTSTNGALDNPLWYKDAIIYELHVRAFHDSDGDGIGDIRGLIQKLDYLQDLGITAIWLLPFYPSPLRDDGYDIADYTDVHPDYGTLRDARLLVREAHKRGLKVITELVCNHTSDQHPWFQRARHAKPGSVWRDFYVWSDTPERYREARIIFKDFETSNWAWDSVANAYYWHRFYSHQPDLNYESAHVRRAIFKALDFWLETGVDGLRLDAVPYLFEREGGNCENLPETHVFLKELRRHIDSRYRDRLLLAEANQWPEDAVAYFGDGDECHMAFHFPLMPRLFMAIRQEDRFPIVDILAQTPPIPDSAQWALFLRNHDELTLEMVTDEERDYMYRVYAHDPRARINLGIRRRLAPLLGNHRRKIELMNGLLFALPGTPVLYYGDEIGMGDNIYLGDRNSVRTPMQWSADRNAGFSRASPQQLYLPIATDPEYHYEAVNVDAQQHNPHSLLWWTKRLIALRKRYQAFGRGSIEFLFPENHKVLAFIRRYADEQVLVIANLSRFVQCVELDLSTYAGLMPVELFGRVEFPPIGGQPYFITLGPHSFYWFALEPQRVTLELQQIDATPARLPSLVVEGDWQAVLRDIGRSARLADILPAHLRQRRWFRGKARHIRAVRILDAVPVARELNAAYITLVQLDYVEGEGETYVLPLAFAAGEQADRVQREQPRALIAYLRATGVEGILYDPSAEQGFGAALLALIAERRRVKGVHGELRSSSVRMPRPLLSARDTALEATALSAEQSNTSLVYGDQLILKIFRRAEAGENPDLEIGRFLTERCVFDHIPPVVGGLEYRQEDGQPATLAILQAFVPNQGDAWRYTLDALGRYFERVLATLMPPAEEMPIASRTLLDLAEREPPTQIYELVGAYLEQASLLGQRTAELHLALASALDDPQFAPEPFTALYQQSIYQSMRAQASRTFQVLRRQLKQLPEPTRTDAEQLLLVEAALVARFRALLDHRISALRIRCHGDYHLGQVLYTGKDFAIIDFEGEPARPLSDRRIKRSPLRDVAGMLRSFHYAAHTALRDQASAALIRQEDMDRARAWAHFWQLWVSAVFLRTYRATADEAPFLPRREELEILLDAFLLEKAVYELGYELNNRPDWVSIPLRGIRDLAASAAAGHERERSVGDLPSAAHARVAPSVAKEEL
jgi:maltose alpha-D-glucosyltransferase/alpha-amylase